MGESGRAANVLRLLGALAQLLGGEAAEARRAAGQSGLQGWGLCPIVKRFVCIRSLAAVDICGARITIERGR